jgi:hypothetical protein
LRFSISKVDVLEGSMGGKHLVITCSLTIRDQVIQTHALIDCGATGIAFMDQDFARHHEVPLRELKEKRQVEVIDGRTIESGDITHLAEVGMNIQDHKEKIPMFVTKLGHYPIVLGIPWLRLHDVAVRFASNTVTFGSQYCVNHCHDTPVTVQGVTEEPPEPIYEEKKLWTADIWKPRPFRGNIVMLNGASFFRMVTQGRLTIFKASLYDINKAIEAQDFKEKPLQEIIPNLYHEFLPLFSKVLADRLPPHRPNIDHEVRLKEGETPSWGPLSKMSREELVVMKEWLKDNLTKGFIRQSSSPYAARCLFAKKPDGGLQFCIDYRDINSKTNKNRYPLPLIQETLDLLAGARIYTKLDVRGAYNLVRVREGDEQKMAFRTRYGLFEPLVVQFGTTNAPADIQGYSNDTIREALDCFASAYLDDILIYSNSIEEHKEHVKWIMEQLLKAGLYLKPEKCEFHKETVKYLELIISTEGISMDPDKIETVRNWSQEKKTANGRSNNLFEVQQFLGFCNYYRRFIKGYSDVAEPLTRLTKKDDPFEWLKDQQEAFEEMIHKFTTAPTLWHFDHSREVIIETDASDYVSAGVLSQRDDDGVLHPVAFLSKKHSPAECNYDIYDKELMAIIKALEEWRSEYEGAEHTLQLITDHKNLEYFMSKKLLNRRQARWAQFLSRFDYEIVYRPWKSNGKADVLTRRPGDLPKGGDERLKTMEQVVLKPQNLPEQLRIHANDLIKARSVHEQLREASEHDNLTTSILDAVRQCTSRRDITVAECSEREGQLYYQGRRYVPEDSELQLRVIREHHDIPLAGHPGRSKTFDLLTRRYYWKTMRKQVDRYVRRCAECQKSRTSRHASFRVLRPLPVPEKPSEDISMDFVTGLPECEGYDAIWVEVDRLSKMRHFIPCRTTVDTWGLAEMFRKDVVRQHGLPKTIISDRGPQYAAVFWKMLCAGLGVDRRVSTAFHPQTDGHTERMNASMEQYLRIFTSHQQDDWVRWLPLAEFAANNGTSETTKCSALFAVTGVDPRMTFEEATEESGDPRILDADQTQERMNQIHAHLRVEMRRSQDIMEDGANRKRLPAPQMQEGTKVWLDPRHIRTTRPSRNVDRKRLGPYTVKRRMSHYAYELDLPRGLRIHPVHHVSLFDPVAEDPLPGQVVMPPPPVEVEGDSEYQVERVEDSRVYRNQLQYLVRLTGYDQMTWEPARDIDGLQAIDVFHERYPQKPGALGMVLGGPRS